MEKPYDNWPGEAWKSTLHVNRRTLVGASITDSSVVAASSLLSGCGNSDSVDDEGKETVLSLLAVGLVALETAVIARVSDGERQIPIAQVFRQPGGTPDRDRVLRPGEIIVAVDVPTGSEMRRSGKAPNPRRWRSAAARAADGAKPLSENGFKVDLLKRTVERELAAVAGQR